MNKNTPPVQQKPVQNTAKKPNERAGFTFSSGVTIKDPDTGKIIVQLRCS